MSRFASTIALAVLTALAGGCGRSREPAAAPPPAPPPRASIPWRDIQVCVVERGMARTVTAQFNVVTGDTSFDRGSDREWRVEPRVEYAADAPWFVGGEPITVEGRRYVKFGTPRVVPAAEVVRVADHAGITVFAEARAARPPAIVYVPVRRGCLFQPYALEPAASGVRGG